MEKDRKFRALAIAAICVAIVGVSVAYAALATTLTINGTATVSTNNAWDVRFLNPTQISKSNAVTVNTAPTLNGTTTANWAVTFGAPKTSYVFEITFKNNGTIPAKLAAGTYITQYATTGSEDANTEIEHTVIVKGGTSIEDYDNYILEPTKEVTLVVTTNFDADGSLSGTELSNLNAQEVGFGLSLPFVQASDAEVAAGQKF